MKRFLLALCIIQFTSFINAQEVENIHFEQQGKIINIYYDLIGEATQNFEVKVMYSINEGQNWLGPLVFVNGNVGKDQKPAYNKSITWNVLKETEKLNGQIIFKIEVISSSLPEMVFVKGGAFQMGNDSEGIAFIPEHKVTLNDFYMGKFEVTNKQYCEFLNTISCSGNGVYNGIRYIDVGYKDIPDMGHKNYPIYYRDNHFVTEKRDDNKPVFNITWHGAESFCTWAGGRLPTEAEWEYAARGGASTGSATTTKYAGSNNIDEVAWYSDNSGSVTHVVGQKKPNELGIYDMTGNVSEWCSDWYDQMYYKKSPQNNPQGRSSGTWKGRVYTRRLLPLHYGQRQGL